MTGRRRDPVRGRGGLDRRLVVGAVVVVLASVALSGCAVGDPSRRGSGGGAARPGLTIVRVDVGDFPRLVVLASARDPVGRPIGGLTAADLDLVGASEPGPLDRGLRLGAVEERLAAVRLEGRPPPGFERDVRAASIPVAGPGEGVGGILLVPAGVEPFVADRPVYVLLVEGGPEPTVEAPLVRRYRARGREGLLDGLARIRGDLANDFGRLHAIEVEDGDLDPGRVRRRFELRVQQDAPPYLGARAIVEYEVDPEAVRAVLAAGLEPFLAEIRRVAAAGDPARAQELAGALDRHVPGSVDVGQYDRARLADLLARRLDADGRRMASDLPPARRGALLPDLLEHVGRLLDERRERTALDWLVWFRKAGPDEPATQRLADDLYLPHFRALLAAGENTRAAEYLDALAGVVPSATERYRRLEAQALLRKALALHAGRSDGFDRFVELLEEARRLSPDDPTLDAALEQEAAAQADLALGADPPDIGRALEVLGVGPAGRHTDRKLLLLHAREIVPFLDAARRLVPGDLAGLPIALRRIDPGGRVVAATDPASVGGTVRRPVTRLTGERLEIYLPLGGGEHLGAIVARSGPTRTDGALLAGALLARAGPDRPGAFEILARALASDPALLYIALEPDGPIHPDGFEIPPLAPAGTDGPRSFDRRRPDGSAYREIVVASGEGGRLLRLAWLRRP